MVAGRLAERGQHGFVSGGVEARRHRSDDRQPDVARLDSEMQRNRRFTRRAGFIFVDRPAPRVAFKNPQHCRLRLWPSCAHVTCSTNVQRRSAARTHHTRPPPSVPGDSQNRHRYVPSFGCDTTCRAAEGCWEHLSRHRAEQCDDRHASPPMPRSPHRCRHGRAGRPPQADAKLGYAVPGCASGQPRLTVRLKQRDHGRRQASRHRSAGRVEKFNLDGPHLRASDSRIPR